MPPVGILESNQRRSVTDLKWGRTACRVDASILGRPVDADGRHPKSRSDLRIPPRGPSARPVGRLRAAATFERCGSGRIGLTANEKVSPVARGLLGESGGLVGNRRISLTGF